MHDAGLRVLVDTIMSQIQFHRIITDQAEVGALLQKEDPNLMKFIESGLQETEAAS